MNENINLVEILKDCPKGTKFYSSVYGELIYSGMYTDSLDPKIYFIDENNRSIIVGYYRDGRLYNTKGECTIFPSEYQRDWSKFTAPWLKKEKFDPKTLKPFDKVLVRIGSNSHWTSGFFSHIADNSITHKYVTQCGSFNRCIPYNDETKYLVSTAIEAPEYYRYWEN